MRWVFKGIGIAVIVSLIFFGLGWVTMQLWNALMPAIFGLKVITYWQAFGLLVLSKILFSGFRGGRHHCGHGWGRHRSKYWRKRWEEKMAKMTPEQKEKFMRGMENCDWGGRGWHGHWHAGCDVEEENSANSGGQTQQQ